MQTKWLPHEDCAVLLRLLTPENALAMELALATGLRIGDVLGIRADQLRQRMTITQKKTGAKKRVYISNSLLERLKALSGAVWVFEHRTDPQKHKTRQAVWKDVKRASKAMRVKSCIGCHSARKVYAVEIFRRSGLGAAQKALGHDRPETTLIYLASELCASESH